MQNSVIAPKYAHKFKCIGGRCPDTCCKDWKISIDALTYKKYRTNIELIPIVDAAIIENRDEATKSQIGGYIQLDPVTNKCKLLDTSGLCSLERQFGINALCLTCVVYPRKLQELGEDSLLTLSDSCPVVAEALVTDPDALELEFKPIDLHPYVIAGKVSLKEKEDDALRYFLLQSLITILRHREKSLEMRLFICGLLIQKVQPLIDNNQAEELEKTVQIFYSLISSNFFEEQAKGLNEKSDGSLGLVILNIIQRQIKGGGAKLFNYELVKALIGLKVNPVGKLGEEHLKLLDNAREEYLARLEEDFPHALENILVNWLLRSLFPMEEEKLMTGWTNIMARYLLLRTLLSGVALEQKKLDEKDLIRISYLFGRNINHGGILKRLMVELIGKKLNTITAFSLALKP